MKVIYYCNSNQEKLDKNKKHLVNFFGLLACIKVNASTDSKEESVNHYFDYPGFDAVVNPELFEEELNKREKRTTSAVIVCFIVSFSLSATLLYFAYKAYKKQESIHLITSLASMSLIFSVLSSILFVIACTLVFFNYIKEKFVTQIIQNQLKDMSNDELIRIYKDRLLNTGSKENGTSDGKQTTDEEKLFQFFLERKKVLSLFKFLTNGEESVQAGMAIVNKLLMAGIHPNNIILDTNSLGGGVAAEVLKRFEEKGIYLTLIHNNSFSSLKDATNNFPNGVGDFFKRWLPAKFLNFWFKYFGLEFNPKKIIENTRCPVLIAGRIGDKVISGDAQLMDQLPDKDGKGLRCSVTLEHDPQKNTCSNIKNIHADQDSHFVIVKAEDKSNIGTSYSAFKEAFIKKAREYLVTNELNKKEKIGEYIKSLEEQTPAQKGHAIEMVQLTQQFKPFDKKCATVM